MSEVLSLLVWCRHDRQTDALQVQVVNADTGKEVAIRDGNFLLRIFSLEGGSVQRCFIRHVASGREAYVQGGSHLRAFVKACLFQAPESSPEAHALAGREEVSDEQQARSEPPPPDSSEDAGT